MKTIRAAVLAVIALALPVFAQDGLPERYATAGVFFNADVQPHVTGFGAYATKVAPNTYSYTVMDVTSRSLRNFKPQTSTTTGIAERTVTFGGASVFTLLTVGAAVSGNSRNDGADVGFAGSGGFLFVKPVGAKGWSVNVPIRVLFSTLGSPQYVVGFGFGWGGK